MCSLQLWTREAATQPGAWPVPSPLLSPRCRPSGLLQGCWHRSLLPALACDMNPCCRRRGLLLSNRPQGVPCALTPPAHLPVDLGAPAPHTALACPGRALAQAPLLRPYLLQQRINVRPGAVAFQMCPYLRTGPQP